MQFATATTTYGVRTTVGGAISDCVSGSDFAPTVIAGVAGYKSTKTLEACVINGGNLYAIVARTGVAPSKDLNDSVYARLLTTFKFAK